MATFKTVKKIFFDGFQLLIPLFLAVFVLIKIFELISTLLKPLVNILPETSFFEDSILDLRALFIFLLLIYCCGLLIHYGVGKYFLNSLTSRVMRIVPGYSVFERIINEEKKVKGKNNSVVFATLDDAWIMGIIIEDKNDDGLILVYIPSAPIPTGGSLYMFTEEQVKRVNISVSEALKFVWHLGKDSDKILKGNVKW